MTSSVAAMILAATVATLVEPAVCFPAQTAEPFPEVSISVRRSDSHAWSYLTIGAGLGMIGASFAIADHANRRYDDYLAATDPASISHLYDQTVRDDHLANVALLGGEVMIAVGLYYRFLRPPSSRVQWSLGASRCAVALRF